VAGLWQDFSSTTADSVFMITGSADNDYTEVSAALTNAKTFIGSSNKLAIIYFPEGTYHFDSPITLDSTYRNIVFQGAGSDRTTLVFRNMRNSHCLVLQGATPEGPIALEHDFVKGENRIYPASGSWTTGQWIWFLVYNYDYRSTSEEPEEEIVGQVTRIDSLGTDGNGYFLQIKDKANMNYLHLPGDGRPMRVYKVTPIQNIGIEDLKIMRSPHENAYGAAHPFNIYIDAAVNCWVKGVESYKPSCHHLSIMRSSQCEVSGCYFHEAMDYCGGGWGYGVQLYQSTTNCLIENNIFRSLRHSLVAAAGSNCNVWTFNYSREQLYTIVGDPLDDPTYRDLDLHAKWPFGHLFEQNLIEEIGADGNDDNGANGFYNTFVRNYCYDQDVITIEKMENWSFVGNIKDDFDDKKALRYDADWNPIIDLFGFRNGYTTPCTHLSNYLYGYTCQWADRLANSSCRTRRCFKIGKLLIAFI